MTKKTFSKPSTLIAPKLEVIQTENGKVYRTIYGGIVREHIQEWKAQCWYEQLVDAWRQRMERYQKAQATLCPTTSGITVK